MTTATCAVPAERKSTRRELKVAVLTREFPEPFEPYTTAELHHLRSQGVEANVHCLWPQRSRHSQLVRERGLDDVRITYSSSRTWLRAIGFALLRPAVFCFALGCVVRACIPRVWEIGGALQRLPRSLEICADVLEESPDIVHLYWGDHPCLAGLLIHKFARQTQVTMFLGATDLQRAWGLTRLLSRRCALVFTHCQYNVAPLVRLGVPPERIRVVVRGVSIEPMRSAVRKTSGRIVTVSELCGAKRCAELLRTFAMLHQRRPDLTLTFVGDGAARRTLERQAARANLSDAVVFTGHLPHAQVMDEVATADYFLFFSLRPGERLPNAVKEAMAHGCVCFAARSAGMDELIEDGVSGYLLDTIDPPAAAEFILARMNDLYQLRELRSAAAARIESLFDVRYSMQAYDTHWRSLTGQTVMQHA